jgi:Putative peptidoglycan binding domain
MQINRFHKFPQADYSMKFYAPEVYLPNLEAWNSVLAKQQKSYDDALSIKNKYPKYLQGREQMAEQYMQGVDQNVNDITNAYTEKGISEGNRKMRDFGMSINKAWQPGGLAHELESEYTDYQTAAENIDKYYKDQKAENSANREFSLSKLQEVVKNPINYNEKTGLYTRNAISPSLIPYVDISEEALKLVKEIKESGRTDIVKMSPFWFEKIQREGVTEETVRAVTDSLLDQPKYQQQQQVELWKAKRQYTPEQLQALEEGAKKQYVDSFNKQLGQVDALAQSKKPQDVKDLQKQLIEAGLYSGKIDGVMGKETKHAIEEYKKRVTEKSQEKVGKITADNILANNIKESYMEPLIKAFTRQKIERSLIFNQEAELKAKLAAQRQGTASMVGAIQSLGKAPEGNTLVTPGLSSPVETLNKLKESATNNVTASKTLFNNVVKAGDLKGLAGTDNPQTINEITEIRLRSKSPEDFATQLLVNGYVGVTDSKGLYDFYSSPAAVDLNSAYKAMSAASAQQKGLLDAEVSMQRNFTETPEGKEQLKTVREKTGFKGTDDELVKAIVNDDAKLNKQEQQYGFVGSTGAQYNPVSTGVNYAKMFKDKSNKYFKENGLQLPVALRGYTINSDSGEGKALEGVIKDDIISGYSLGYTDGKEAGINFKVVGGGSKVDMEDVDMDKADIKINIDGNNVTYYITAKQKGKDGKNVTAVAVAPKEHNGRLNNLALHMKREAVQTGDQSLDALSNQLYSVSSTGPQQKEMVSDALVINEQNGKQLSNVIDEGRSNAYKSIQTYKDNKSVIGKQVEEEINFNGNIYQKFKVSDPKAGGQRYMLTMKTDKGYLPVKNKQGGLYYDTSSEAGYVLTDMEMMSKIPVDIDQKKIYGTNLTEDQQKATMLGVQSLESLNDL